MTKITRLGMLVLLAVLGPQCSGVSTYLLQGQPAPKFSLKTLDGTVFNLAEHLGKRPVVLDFWAVWCPPCREALPKIAALHNKYKDKDVVVFTVNLGDAPESIKTFLKEKKLDVPVALDTEGAAAEVYDVRSIPTMVFINREGIISKVTIGAPVESILHETVDKLL